MTRCIHDSNFRHLLLHETAPDTHPPTIVFTPARRTATATPTMKIENRTFLISGG